MRDRRMTLLKNETAHPVEVRARRIRGLSTSLLSGRTLVIDHEDARAGDDLYDQLQRC